MSNAQNQDERIAKRADAGLRGDRSAQDRNVTEDREASDPLRIAERLSMLRDVNTKLPQAPQIPGYHTFWATTTNQSDPLEHRFRLGYELVKPSELPGFCLPTQQSGTVTSDRIQINEMVLTKIPLELVEAYVTHLHHELPQEHLRELRQSVNIQRDGRGREVGYTGGDRDGSFVGGVSDGFRILTKAARPSFAGVL